MKFTKEQHELAQNRVEELLSLVPSNPKEYFEQAKKVMDKWDNALKDVIRHDERKEQHLIACKNRNSKEYAVLDIEYSVSRKSKFSYNCICL